MSKLSKRLHDNNEKNSHNWCENLCKDCLHELLGTTTLWQVPETIRNVSSTSPAENLQKCNHPLHKLNGAVILLYLTNWKTPIWKWQHSWQLSK